MEHRCRCLTRDLQCSAAIVSGVWERKWDVVVEMVTGGPDPGVSQGWSPGSASY